MSWRCLLAVGLWLAGCQEASALACTAAASSTSFGSYNPASLLATDGVGNVRVACSTVLINVLVGYTISLSAGSSGSYAVRRLQNGSNHLNYNLYSDFTRLTVWGDGSGGSSSVSDSYLLVVLTLARDYPVYGRIPAGQNVPAGSYADTILVTVNY
ncbi:MAG TPA: spore coat U domain-containing protein [Rhodocyclaceae bacterium]|nr:spore coat U domain-containing protein [Rhodocyclaceae bacterium]